MKPTPLALFGLLCAAAAPSMAQAAPLARENAARENAARESGVSLGALLQLPRAQTARLERLALDFAARRAARDSKIAALQTQMEQARSVDARRVAPLEREAVAARQKQVAEGQKARSKARASLSPVQSSQLDALSSDPRFRLRRDALYELLIAPLDDRQTASSSDAGARQNWLDARRLAGQSDLNRAQGVGSYGVYGGYSHGGPQLGVYGGYQQGAVGVHGGIGLGGPSVGISIGRVFGVGRR